MNPYREPASLNQTMPDPITFHGDEFTFDLHGKRDKKEAEGLMAGWIVCMLLAFIGFVLMIVGWAKWASFKHLLTDEISGRYLGLQIASTLVPILPVVTSSIVIDGINKLVPA